MKTPLEIAREEKDNAATALRNAEAIYAPYSRMPANEWGQAGREALTQVRRAEKVFESAFVIFSREFSRAVNGQ